MFDQCITRAILAVIAVRALRFHLIAIANGETPPGPTADPPDLTAFIASLLSAWRAGEIRPTFSVEAQTRSCEACKQAHAQIEAPRKSAAAPATTVPARPQVVYAASAPSTTEPCVRCGLWRAVASKSSQPSTPTQLFEELCLQFPGQLTVRQYRSLNRRVKR
jgi:hypothetical protein